MNLSDGQRGYMLASVSLNLHSWKPVGSGLKATACGAHRDSRLSRLARVPLQEPNISLMSREQETVVKTSKSPGSNRATSNSENNVGFPEQNFVRDQGSASIRNRLTLVPYAGRLSRERVHLRLTAAELRTTLVLSGTVSVIGGKAPARKMLHSCWRCYASFPLG